MVRGRMPGMNLEMQAGSTEMPVPSRRRGPYRKKTHLKSLKDVDPRTTAYRRTLDLIRSIETDLGGNDQLSTGERQIIQRAALTGALLEDLEARWLNGEPIDLAVYVTLGNAQRRLLETVGLKRVARDVTPTLAEYLAKYEAKKSEAPATAGGQAAGRDQTAPFAGFSRDDKGDGAP
jgi:hypothetical protein